MKEDSSSNNDSQSNSPSNISVEITPDSKQTLDLILSGNYGLNLGLQMLIKKILNEPNFLAIAREVTHGIKNNITWDYSAYTPIIEECFERINSSPSKKLTNEEFIDFIQILSNLRFKDHNISVFCSEYIKGNISNFDSKQLSLITNFVANYGFNDQSLIENLSSALRENSPKLIAREKIPIAHSLQRILQTQSLSGKNIKILKELKDSYITDILYAYKDPKRKIKISAKELSQIQNLLVEINRDIYYRNRDRILNIISTHDLNNFLSARQQEVQKGVTDSSLHDSIYTKLKQKYPDTEKEKWLENAALSVDIFIEGKYLGCTKDIVIQVDGGSHFYTGDGTITTKTIHNTKDLEDAGYVVIRGGDIKSIRRKLAEEISKYKIDDTPQKEITSYLKEISTIEPHLSNNENDPSFQRPSRKHKQKRNHEEIEEHPSQGPPSIEKTDSRNSNFSNEFNDSYITPRSPQFIQERTNTGDSSVLSGFDTMRILSRQSSGTHNYGNRFNLSRQNSTGSDGFYSASEGKTPREEQAIKRQKLEHAETHSQPIGPSTPTAEERKRIIEETISSRRSSLQPELNSREEEFKLLLKQYIEHPSEEILDNMRKIPSLLSDTAWKRIVKDLKGAGVQTTNKNPNFGAPVADILQGKSRNRTKN